MFESEPEMALGSGFRFVRRVGSCCKFLSESNPTPQQVCRPHQHAKSPVGKRIVELSIIIDSRTSLEFDRS
jgi:hypothetical protein